MIPAIIRWSVGNRFLVLLLTVMLTAWGLWSVKQTPVDALPDLSDVQVIIKTAYPGQAPQVVEDQVTYPLTTAMLAVPGATTVRGYSFFGDSFVYVLFDDDTDLYWARARVLEYLSQVAPNLPASARPQLGPDATGVGWIYQYALVDKSGRHDLAPGLFEKGARRRRLGGGHAQLAQQLGAGRRVVQRGQQAIDLGACGFFVERGGDGDAFHHGGVSQWSVMRDSFGLL